MKFTVDAKPFRAALAAASKIVPSRGTLPVLSHVLIDTNDSRITITGTDMDQALEQTVAAEVATEGAACINLAALSGFCAAAKGDQIEIDVTGGSAAIKSGRSRITLSTLPADAFYHMPASEGDTFTVDAPSFAHALRFCVSAASREESRYYLCGVYLHSEPEGLMFWGTNGYALHHAEISGFGDIGGGGIVPTDAVSVMCSILDRGGLPRVMVNDRAWLIEGDCIRAWGKVIDGTFPDARRVMDQFSGWTRIVTAEVEDISSAIGVATCGTDVLANKSRGLSIIAKDGDPVVIRGARGSAGVVSAGRAETDALAQATAACAVSSELLAATVANIGVDVLAVSIAEDGGAVRVDPAQGNAVLTLAAVIIGMRANEGELTDG